MPWSIVQTINALAIGGGIIVGALCGGLTPFAIGCAGMVGGSLWAYGKALDDTFNKINQGIDRAKYLAEKYGGKVYVRVDPLRQKVVISALDSEGRVIYSYIVSNTPGQVIDALRQTNRDHQEFCNTSGVC